MPTKFCVFLLWIFLAAFAVEGMGDNAPETFVQETSDQQVPEKSRVKEIMSGAENKRKDELEQVGGEKTNIVEFRTLQEKNRFWLIGEMLLVTPLFLLIILHYVVKGGNYSVRSVLNISGLVLVVQATTIVVLAAQTSEQLTAAIGVLGAIAGYLFGSTKQSTGLDSVPAKPGTGSE